MVRRPLGNHHHGPDTLLVTSTETDSETMELLRELITRTRVVLWDFDGPICRLFAGHTADGVADGLVGWLEARGMRDLLTEDERKSLDPHFVLRAVHRARPGSDLVAELEEILTQQELKAVRSAWPTPWADPVIRTWAALGVRLAITTNNAPRVVRAYLSGRGLESCFAPHIYGRTPQLHLLKPHPHSLNIALRAMGSAPADALMIGDAATDFEAACRAGVPFLGYARNGDKAQSLRAAGVTAMVGTLEPVLTALRAHA
ncbi:HAD family hydrolase [Streptomyces sp. NPDC018693]|uniref:HAD family hydrolase n=1 Tax=unclassified Streptomyces TaxID=2593676 RepID=UPI0037A9584E